MLKDSPISSCVSNSRFRIYFTMAANASVLDTVV